MNEYSSKEQPRFLLSPSATRDRCSDWLCESHIAYRMNRIGMGGEADLRSIKTEQMGRTARMHTQVEQCQLKLRKVRTDRSARSALKSRFHLSSSVICS